MRLIYAILSLVLTASLAHAQVEALDQVNAQRAARGLKPFIRDDLLTAGALNVSKFRADRLMFGHTGSDQSGLPRGAIERFPYISTGGGRSVSQIAGGYAAYPPSYGFMACAVYDDYKFAGAAYTVGRDGKRYCQLFVAGGPASLRHASMMRGSR